MLMKTVVFFLMALICVQAGCIKSEMVRVQKQREAATRYPSANWMERRDIVRNIVRYYGKDKNDLVNGILTYGCSDPHPAVRIEALQSFAKIKSKPALPVIQKTARTDSDNNVRWYAIQSLRSFNDPSSAEIFIQGLDSSDWLIREESIKGICSLDDGTIRVKLVPYIIKAMHDSSTSVMLTTLRQVKTRDDRIYRAITEKLKSATDSNFSLLEACLMALKGYRLDSKIKEKVIGLLLHNNPQIRVLALRVLKEDRILSKP
jgi:HEAT repeat protein